MDVVPSPQIVDVAVPPAIMHVVNIPVRPICPVFMVSAVTTLNIGFEFTPNESVPAPAVICIFVPDGEGVATLHAPPVPLPISRLPFAEDEASEMRVPVTVILLSPVM